MNAVLILQVVNLKRKKYNKKNSDILFYFFIHKHE